MTTGMEFASEMVVRSASPWPHSRLLAWLACWPFCASSLHGTERVSGSTAAQDRNRKEAQSRQGRHHRPTRPVEFRATPRMPRRGSGGFCIFWRRYNLGRLAGGRSPPASTKVDETSNTMGKRADHHAVFLAD